MSEQNAGLSFREMKAQQLSAERGESEEPAPRLTSEDPEVEDVVDTEEDNAIEEEPIEESELDEPTDELEADDDDEDSTEDYRAKYTELEKEYRRVTENRKKREQEHAEAMSNFVRSKHEFEDTITEAKRGAEYYANLANQQVAQFQNINWSQVPPDQVQNLQMQAAQAQQFAHQRMQEFESLKQWEQERRDQLRSREAEMAVARLRASIPEWSNEHYQALGEVAREAGFSPEEYGEITDPRIIELLHYRWKTEQAVKGVKKTVKQRKAKPPQNRSGKLPPRNVKGQFRQAEKDFRENPNRRGAFAKLKAAQLQMERRGR